MSTTRIIFIIVCVVLAVIVFTIGFVMQKNDPDSKYAVSKALNPKTLSKRKKRNNLFSNSGSYITMFLLIVIIVLFLVFSRR